MLGRNISHYEIIEELGRGGMGVVYRAHDQRLDRMVALKFLGADLVQDHKIRKRFENEARTASSLDHPNICTIHEIGETDDGHTYIVMPAYEGMSLQARARAGLNVDEAVGLVLQAAHGLAKAHQKGIVHRDVKSQNLFVTRDGHVKVLDFGLAILADQTRITQAGATVGTLQYMPPEQARGEELDRRADIYSLGVVLYELLTGKLPFGAENMVALVSAIVNDEPPPPSALRPGIPAELDAIVLRAMAKNRDARYPGLETMISELERTRGQATTARAPVRKRGRGRVSATMVLVVAVAALAVVLLRDRAPKTPVVSRDAAPAIAVLFVENLSADPALEWMEQGVVELLNTALSMSQDITVVGTQRIAETMKSIGVGAGEEVDAQTAGEIGRRIGVGSYIVGDVMRAGPTLRLQLRRVDVDSGRILFSDRADGGGERDLFTMVATLTERIQNDLQIARIAETVDEQWMRDITTSTVDAYRDYVLGRSFFIRNEHELAREYFERAIAADPDFVMAYVELMGVCFNLEDYACIDETYQEARRLRPTASQKEKLCIDLIGSIIAEDADRQIATANELLRLEPSSRFWRYALGRGHYKLGSFEAALRDWEPLIEDGYTWIWTYAYGSDACLQLGLHDRALAILDRGLEITSAEDRGALARLYRYRGRAHRARGDFDGAASDFEHCVELEPSYEPTIALEIGLLHEARGDIDKAILSYEACVATASDADVVASARARIEAIRQRGE